MIEIEAVDGVKVSDWADCINAVNDHVIPVALFEQMAEEATELAHAALKVARIVRGDNPTPVTRYEAMKNLQEELADLAVVCEVLDMEPDKRIMMQKLNRWKDRVKGHVENRV